LVELSRKFDHKPSRRTSNRKNITRTFRIKSTWDDVLREEAKKEGISVNVLVNSILRRYALFDRWTRNYRVTSITQDSLRILLDKISLENLAMAGEARGPTAIQNIMDTMGLPPNYDSFTFLLTNFFGGGYALWFSCYRHFRENSDIFHLQHNLGREWSIFLQNYFCSYLKTLKMDCETKLYENAVNIKVHRTRLSHS
jgi:hypothetical protein